MPVHHGITEFVGEGAAPAASADGMAGMGAARPADGK